MKKYRISEQEAIRIAKRFFKEDKSHTYKFAQEEDFDILQCRCNKWINLSIVFYDFHVMVYDKKGKLDLEKSIMVEGETKMLLNKKDPSYISDLENHTREKALTRTKEMATSK